MQKEAPIGLKSTNRLVDLELDFYNKSNVSTNLLTPHSAEKNCFKGAKSRNAITPVSFKTTPTLINRFLLTRASAS
jgi:hypothetical protein